MKILGGRLKLWLWSNTDIACAVFGIALMLASVVVLEEKGLHELYTVAVMIGMLCVAVYLIFRNKLSATEARDTKHFWHYILASLVLIVLGIVAFAFRPEQYTKPTSYYIIMALASGVLVLAAISSDSMKHLFVVLAVACAIGVTHTWTENMLFPDSLIGLDPWYHFMVVTKELPSDTTRTPIGITTIGTSYSLMHLYLRAIMDIFPIGYKMAAMVFVGLPQTIGCIVLVGLLGKELFSIRVGAVAAVLLATANWQLFFGEWIIPNSTGVLMALTVAYLIITKSPKLNYWVRTVLVASILAVAYCTHFLSAVWVVGTIGCLYGPYFIRAIVRALKKGSTWKQRWQSAASVVLFLVMLLSLPVWMNSTTVGSAIAHTTDNYSFNPSFGMTTYIAEPVKEIPETPIPTLIPNQEQPVGEPTIPPSITPNSDDNTTVSTEIMRRNALPELVLDSMGMILFFGLAIVGSLIILRRNRAILRVLWIVLGLTVLAIGFFPPLFGKSLLEYRWWYLAETILAIPLAVLIVAVCAGKVRTIVAVVAVIVLAFLSTIGLPSNNTNRALSPNLTVRYSFTSEEVDALKQISKLAVPSLGTDPLYCNPISYDSEYKGVANPVESNFILGTFSEIPYDVIVIREALYKEPFGFGGGTIYKISPCILGMAKEQGYTEIWSNGAVHILQRMGK